MTIVGCAREEPYRVRFVSEPAGAVIVAAPTASAGTGVVKPVANVVKLYFGDEPSYLVEARPLGALEEGYRTTRLEVRRGDVHFLPTVGGVRVFTIKLLPTEFSELSTYEVVYAPGRGVMALKTRRRAYERVVEDSGHAVEPVMPLKDCDGVRGLALSPRADRIAYGAFTVAAAVETASAETKKSSRNGRRVPESVEARLVEIAQSQIRVFLVKGTGRQTITSGKYIDLDPSFSADGQWLIFSGNRDRFTLHDIYKQGAETRTAVSLVTQEMDGHAAFWPTESAGGLVAFSQIGPEAASLADAKMCTKSGPTGYLSIVQDGVQPAISPDGKRIAYIKNGDLHVSDSDGGQEVRLTSDAEEIAGAYRASLPDPAERDRFDRFERRWLFMAHSYPTWTRDGKWIVHTSMKGRDPEGRPNEDIVAIAADGGREIRLTTNPSADREPILSSDGKWLYFLSNRGRQWAVWRMPMPELPQN